MIFSFIRTPGYSNYILIPLGGSNNRESTVSQSGKILLGEKFSNLQKIQSLFSYPGGGDTRSENDFRFDQKSVPLKIGPFQCRKNLGKNRPFWCNCSKFSALYRENFFEISTISPKNFVFSQILESYNALTEP